jgi:general secretion pathway protein E
VDAGEELSIASIADDTSPVVRLVSSMLYDALRAEASDIHIESDARGAVIKYRLDGVLDTISRIEDPDAGRTGGVAHQGSGRTGHR